MEIGNFISVAKPAETFYQKETFCESLFRQGGPYWHLCTPGTNQEIIFSSREEMIAGMNLLAIIAIEFNIKIFTLCLMNNHIHLILACDEEVGYQFFKAYKNKLLRYMHSIGRDIDLKDFNLNKMIPIDTLEQLRHEIVYVNRNGYAANRNHNPFSYPWGAGCLYFNKLCKYWTGAPYSRLSYDEKRKVLHGRYREVDRDLLLNDGMILPASYCFIKEGEKFFRDNWHYFPRFK